MSFMSIAKQSNPDILEKTIASVLSPGGMVRFASVKSFQPEQISDVIQMKLLETVALIKETN